jgi:hypothetical protein
MASSSNDSPNDTGDKAFSNAKTDPDTSRGESKDRVGTPVTSSFDERTSVTQPFVTPDGRQDNGAPDLSRPEGARRQTAREGDKTTVEETNVAIKEGTISGNQKLGSEEAQEPAKNPVAEAPETGADKNVDTQVTGKNTKPAKAESTPSR